MCVTLCLATYNSLHQDCCDRQQCSWFCVFVSQQAAAIQSTSCQSASYINRYKNSNRKALLYNNIYFNQKLDTVQHMYNFHLVSYCLMMALV